LPDAASLVGTSHGGQLRRFRAYREIYQRRQHAEFAAKHVHAAVGMARRQINRIGATQSIMVRVR